ncbi:MAG TPA: ABC transporter substrate-binding protein [Ilumatobacteraceae bacterium]|nr:ABC transporter substrate-binding protein [Ilumatobacteraceae bacterium]
MIDARRLIALVLTTGLTIAACSDADEVTPPTSAPATTTTVPPETSGDGRLVIGVLLPRSDTVLGGPMIAAVESAVDAINAAGGVLGNPVRTIVADEGSTTGSATTGIQTLLENDVDAIIGPASSTIALATLGGIVSAGTLACSPTASALALDSFPDGNLFFRTVPSDSLQAQAIADVADQTGALEAVVVHVDDVFGRSFAAAVEAAMAGGAISVGSTFAFTGRDDDLVDDAASVMATGAQVVIVLADTDDGTRFLEALDAVDTDEIATIVVNDALRNPTAPQRIARLDDDLRRKIVGIAPQAGSTVRDAPFDPPGPFATNAFDCANLIALAAVRAQSDVPADIALQIPSVSSSGSVCRTFADCVAAIDAGLQIDYNGPSGLTEIGRNGDPNRAVFDRFLFDSDGRDVFDRSVTASN